MNRADRRASERARRKRVLQIKAAMVTCPECNGSGCAACHGHGVVDRKKPDLSK